jgi:hypothetical protein
MKDVTSVTNTYRECVRHLWNTYFCALADVDWDLRDHFNEIALNLFRALVLRSLDRGDVELTPDHWMPVKPLMFLRIDVDVRSSIMINRETNGGYWDHPIAEVEKGDMEMAFLQFFDWSLLEQRDWAYYRVRIVSSERYPEVVGKDALVPVGVGVRVFYEGAA